MMLLFTLVFSRGKVKAEGFLSTAPTIVNPGPISYVQAADYRSKIADNAQLLRDEIDKMDVEANEIAEGGDQCMDSETCPESPDSGQESFYIDIQELCRQRGLRTAYYLFKY